MNKNIHHNGKIHDCICIKSNWSINENLEKTNHDVGNKYQCMEICNKDNDIIGYYIKYDTFRFRCFDFNEYYKIIN